MYVGGYDVWRHRVSGTLDEERQTLHLMDDQRRVATIETKTVASGSTVTSPTSYVRYQLDDHLGSSRVECDGTGALLTYEEYHPYGTTAFRASSGASGFAPKRYRYTGKERDEETGLYYYGARYYPPWLGMWIAAEEPPSSPWGEEPKPPGERVDPVREFGAQLRRSHQVARYNAFLFVRNSPVSGYDPDGNDVIEVGSIYYAEGVDVKGERFNYTGKTRRQLDERLATHHKKAAILADKTSIEERKVEADVDLTQSTAKQNKAKDEALSVVEYDIMAEAEKKGIKSLTRANLTPREGSKPSSVYCVE